MKFLIKLLTNHPDAEAEARPEGESWVCSEPDEHSVHIQESVAPLLVQHMGEH